jgi:hypothetical protein
LFVCGATLRFAAFFVFFAAVALSFGFLALQCSKRRCLLPLVLQRSRRRQLKKKMTTAVATFFDGFAVKKWRPLPFFYGFAAKKVMATMSSPSYMVVDYYFSLLLLMV